jgi:transposase
VHTAGIELVSPFPPCSPDLNPIEGVWALLKRPINGRRPRLTTYEDIKKALIEEWDSLSPEDYEAMIISMPERVQAVLANEGGHTRW